MSERLLTHERLLDRLVYDPYTGLFVNRVRRSPKAQKGQVAGYLSGDGRPYVCLDNEYYLQSRLAWFYVKGTWPEGEIDHRDGNNQNNRFDNLRDVPHDVNLQNQRSAHVDAKCQMLGVTEHQGRYRARIYVNGSTRHLGLFPTPTAAHAAYLTAKRQTHAGCTI